MVTAVIIDDELHARQTIKAILLARKSEIEIIGEAENVADAVKIIKSLQPQILFLDIDMPDGNGFSVLKQIDYRNYKVIFITAYQEYAIQAIKFSAFDYILKPVNPVELLKAVSNCIAEELAQNLSAKYDAFFSNFNQQQTRSKKIVLKTSERMHVVELAHIIRCEADNAYTTFFLNNGSSVLVSKGLKHFEEMLGSMNFLRVHQSHLINLEYISYFNRQDGGSIVMADNSSVPVSTLKRQALLQYLDSL